MATIDINPASLTIRFTTAEKVLGLLRDIDVPLSSVRSVAVEEDGLGAARGVRAPGLGLPGLRKIGTWRGRGRRAVSVRRNEPAVRIGLGGRRYDELVIGRPDASDIARRVSSAAGLPSA